MPPGTPLSQYLRARRALVRPEDVGLSPGGRRRVSGLRREELALFAGISPNYYLGLEQGRDRHPSAQVLDAIARALQAHEAARGRVDGGLRVVGTAGLWLTPAEACNIGA
jgi:transcriptional regulator with XRE-family HTH domain